MQFAEQDTKLLIAGEHFLVEIWSINENKPFATLDGHLNARSSVYGLTLLSDGNLMCMATSSGVIEMWDIHQKELIKYALPSRHYRLTFVEFFLVILTRFRA